MPYRQRHDGLGALQRREEQDIWKLIYMLVGQLTFRMFLSIIESVINSIISMT